MPKYYFSEGVYGDSCYEIDYFYDYMVNEELESLILTEAVKTPEYVYCRYFNEVVEKGESCGKICSYYSPRNNVKGICIHSAPAYENSGKEVTIYIKDIE